MVAVGNISGEGVHGPADLRPEAGCVRVGCIWKGDDYEMQLDRWANDGGAIGRQKMLLDTSSTHAAGPGGHWS